VVATIQFSSASVHRSSTSDARVLVETMHCDVKSDIQRTTGDVRDLARVLKKIASSEIGLLKCEGLIKESEMVID
jgi:hypothetical protein